MPVAASLLLLLAAARAGGALARRGRQPAMLGELLAGFVVGPGVLGLVTMTPALATVSSLAVLILVAAAGLETDPALLARDLRGRGAWVAGAGFLAPLAAGGLAGRLAGLDAAGALVLGLCVSVTALPVSVRLLQDLGRLATRTGRLIIATALADDVLALGLLDVVRRATPAAASAEGFSAGLYGVTGSFVAGLCVTARVVGARAFAAASAAAGLAVNGLVAPLFIGLVGVQLAPAWPDHRGLLPAVLAASIGGKVAGGWLGGRLAGLPAAERWVLAVGLNSRGVMELVIASVARSAGLVGPELFSSLVLMGACTTVMTPPLLQAAYARADREARPASLPRRAVLADAP